MAVTSKQIAELAGVSRGTVDRALHNRGRVNPEVASRIRKIAEELAYEPNRIGQTLIKAPHGFKLGVILQISMPSTIQILLSGITRAAEELKSRGIEVLIRTVPDPDAAQILACIDELCQCGISGLVLTPHNTPEISERMITLKAQNVPVITLNSDLPANQRMCFLGMDHYRAGQTAAGLMHMLLPAGGKVFPLTGHLNHMVHRERLKGFTETFQTEYSDENALLPFQACFDNNDFAYEITQHMVASYPDLCGIFVAAHGQQGVCSALHDAGKEKSVHVIALDRTPSNAELLANGNLAFLLDQQAFKQGYQSIFLLHDAILYGKFPEHPLLYTDISIYTKYNIDASPYPMK